MLVTPDASADGLAPAALPQPSMVFVGRMLGIANGPMRACTSFGTPSKPSER